MRQEIKTIICNDLDSNSTQKIKICIGILFRLCIIFTKDTRTSRNNYWVQDTHD